MHGYFLTLYYALLNEWKMSMVLKQQQPLLKPSASGHLYQGGPIAGSIPKSRSKREQAGAALVEEALKRPGISEVMRVYENWRYADRGLDSYRAATLEPYEFTTTDRSNQR